MERPVIIQGSAGSGKTTVALHRLAWLLHEANSVAKAKNTRVVVMNKSLQIYVCATLPSMGIEGVQTSTFNSWALSIIGKVVRGRPFFKYLNVPSFVEEIKYSEEILKSPMGTVGVPGKRVAHTTAEATSRSLRHLRAGSYAAPASP